MDFKFQPGDRAVLSDSKEILSQYQGMYVTIIRFKDGSYEHHIDGFGDRIFRTPSRLLMPVEAGSLKEVSVSDLMEVLDG